MDYISLEQAYDFGVIPKKGLCIVKGKGTKVWDDKGKEYIDCMSGVSSMNAGHCHPAIVQAIRAQSEKLIHAYGGLYNDTRALYFEKLASVTPEGMKKIFFCNSGTESIEGALKIARGVSGKTEIIAMQNAFHGRTFGSMSATWNSKYTKLFEPLVPGFKHVPFNDIAALTEAVTENTAAIILELVQGEGGVHIATKEYAQAIRKLCNEKNILLIVDEIQTGFGRCGSMFVCMQYGITPDIMCLAKSIANGIPMGAIVCKDYLKLPPKTHGTTFGGNPLAAAAAFATLDVIQHEKLAEKARAAGDYFRSQLKAISSSKIREVRGLGLLTGIELTEPAGTYLDKLIDAGILCLLAGDNILRFLPPLAISKEEIDLVVQAMRNILH
ncbi:acetylornithine/succinylornithine family transaminase [Candidatus Woesearchaeota archaeon]|nr:acetylornithine/succinylornithine family transaminase [Candidatus Woesearchaeota archaeon]